MPALDRAGARAASGVGGFWGGGRTRRAFVLAGGAALAIALGVVAGAAGGHALWPAPAPAPREVRLTIDVPGINVADLAASPDGHQLAIVGTDAAGTARLWLRPIDAFNPRPIAGSEGASGVFWSADSSALGFFARQQLWIVSASGGAPTPITAIDLAAGEISHRWPSFLPDGSRLIFLSVAREPSRTATYETTRDGGPTRRRAPGRTARVHRRASAAGAPRQLVRAHATHGLLLNDYAARGDGQQFLVKREIGGTVSRVRVILNRND